MNDRTRGAKRMAALRWMVVAVLASLVLALRAAAASGGTRDDAGARPAAAPYLSLSTRASHDGKFRAGVVRTEGPWRPGAAQSWTVRITDAGGAPVPDAALEAVVWSPQTGERARAQPWTGGHLGNGRYRIGGLRFPAPGWWNVALRITAGVTADRLAFNLVLSGTAAAGGGW